MENKIPPNDLKLIPPKPDEDEIQLAIPKEDQNLSFSIDHRAFVSAIKKKLNLAGTREIAKLKRKLPVTRWPQLELQGRVAAVTMLVDFCQKMLIGRAV